MDIKPTALGSGIQGIQRGLNSARESAHTIATAQQGSVTDIAGPLIGLKQSLVQVQASVEVVKTVDETLNSLLNDLSDR
jgi:hypothetical protein